MHVRVRYFAIARERVGVGEERVAVEDGASLGDLLDSLVARHASLGSLDPVLRYAVNQEFAGRSTPLSDGDEVSLIPPVAGGSADPRFRVADQPLSLDAVVAAADPGGGGAGGVVTFTGQVRNHSRGREVVRLEYEAHEEMALRVLARIGGECAERWPGVRVAIHHRVGALDVGDLAVVIAAAAPHRAEAFEACRHAIERLKEDCPIWKREVGPDGAEWVGMGP